MSVLVTADLHLTDNERDDYRWSFLPRLRQLIKHYRCEELLVLGDLTEQKDRHSARLVNRLVDEMRLCAKLVPVTILRGNHDYVDASAPFFAFLRRIEGVRWCNAPAVRGTSPSDGLRGLGRTLLLPHCPDPEKDWAEFDLGYYDWLFCHQLFTTGDGEGFGARIHTDIFPKGARVIAGDDHVPRNIGPVTYVGAPYTVDFGDDYEPRVLLLEGSDMQSIPVPGPMKRLVEIASVKELRGRQFHMGDILKVRLRIPADDYDQWPDLRKQVLQWGSDVKVRVHSVQPIIEGKVIRRDRKLAPTRDDKQLLREYAKLKRIDERTLKTGLLLLQ